jgi:glucokinase
MVESQYDGCVVGADLGGTKILAGVVDGAGNILGTAKRTTKPTLGVEKVIDRLVRTITEAVAAANMELGEMRAVCSGSPGPLDPDQGIVIHAPNLTGWENVPLASELSARLGLPACIENDVNLGTWGESAHGAGRGVKNLVGIFVGTGIGGGIMLDGRLLLGWRRAAGEVGHMTMMPDGPVCGCGRRGCLESLASRTAIERDIRSGIAAGRRSLIPDILARDGRDRITSSIIAEAMAGGDTLVTEVAGRAQYYMGLMVASLVNFIDPEMVVLGGGIVQALGQPYLDGVREVAYQYFVNKTSAEDVKIVAAELGDYAGVVGASVCARERLLAG